MKEKLILFGAGHFGQSAYQDYHEKYNILCFADNNKALWGQKLFDIPVIAPSQIPDWMDDNTSLIICFTFYREIVKQVEAMGINEYKIYFDYTLFDKPEPKMKNEVRRCKRCIMDDSSDDSIIITKEGYCSYCISALNSVGKVYFPNAEGERKLAALLKEVKESGKGKKYDCIMGLSGGLDSSYLTYLGYKWGLRILVVHVDDGFDTDISKNNIGKLIERTGFDYISVKPDSEQYADLVVAYMKAGVPNIAVPQDNIDLACIYEKLKEYDIKYFLSGGNFALECILQKGNTYSNLDVQNIRNIHSLFGRGPIDKLNFISAKEVEDIKKSRGIVTVRPLDLIDYNRDRAFAELKDFCGFEYYGRKHLENRLTEFIQLYWFPKKFGVDKRTSHLSSMIVNGQMTREQALKEFSEPLYKEKEMNECIALVKKKFGISDEEFDKIMAAPVHQHGEYNNL